MYCFGIISKYLIFDFPVFSSRANNNWQTNFASIQKSNENSPQSNKKQQRGDIGESARDSLAYSCLLKNELLGTAIDDVKSVADDRCENNAAAASSSTATTSSAKRGLFKFQSPSKQVSAIFSFLFVAATNSPLIVIYLLLLVAGDGGAYATEHLIV